MLLTLCLLVLSRVGLCSLDNNDNKLTEKAFFAGTSYSSYAVGSSYCNGGVGGRVALGGAPNHHFDYHFSSFRPPFVLVVLGFIPVVVKFIFSLCTSSKNFCKANVATLERGISPLA
jgi:hypothetical protein